SEEPSMKRLLAVAVLCMLVVSRAPLRAADSDDSDSPKVALQVFNDFIGDWKGTGSPDNPRPDPRDAWKESVSWVWRFKGDDVYLTMNVANGKYLKKADVRYLPDTKQYQLTAYTTDDQKLEFVGEMKDDVLTLQRVDPTTKETQRVKMN